MMRRAVVTGAGGFIGSALVRELLSQQVEVLAFDLPECSQRLLLPHLPLQIFGINHISQVLDIARDGDYEVFYHFAWAGAAGIDRTDFAKQLENVEQTVQAVKIAKELGCMKFIGAGSLMEKEVYQATCMNGMRSGLAQIYSAAKLAAHCFSKSMAADVNIDHIWAIITNAYGPGEISPRFINQTIRRILHHELLHFTPGEQNYDFVYITDLVHAFYLLGEKGKAFCEYIVGSGMPRPLKKYLLIIKEKLAPDQEFCFGAIPGSQVSLPLEDYDIHALKRDTGYCPKIQFEEGIVRTYDWLKQMEVPR